MKTFQQYRTITEVYDTTVQGRSSVSKPNEGGRVGTQRKKTNPERRRTKSTGGGETTSAKDYKPRSDIGTQKPRSEREQQPTQARGSAGVSGAEAQRKAYRERKARERGVQGKPKDLEKAADKLLAIKPKEKVDPKYKPVKSSGLTTKERKALYKKGERTLRDIRLKNLGKTKESELKHKVTSK